MDWYDSQTQELRLTTTPERVAGARKAHKSVVLGSALIFGALAAVVLGVGLLVIPQRTSDVGVCVVAVGFLAVPLFTHLWVGNMERRAELFLEADGITVVRANAHGVTVAGVVIPYERITCLYANTDQEVYSRGGYFGDSAAPVRAGLPTGGMFGTGLRRRLYRDGAKSTISLCLGIDQMGTLSARPGIVAKVPLTPQNGDDPGRIVVPFGAYLGQAELEALLDFVQQQTDGAMFPMGVVGGDLNWASAQVGASDTREQIWAASKDLLGK